RSGIISVTFPVTFPVSLPILWHTRPEKSTCFKKTHKNNLPLPGGTMSERNSPSKKIQATVRITRSDQTPLQTQEVILAQKEHKFLFGTAAFDLLPLTNGEYSGANLEKAEERAHK